MHSGAGAYICGEETALLDSLEGYRGQPRLKPPFPAVAGLYACPTVVNNVESIATVPYILGHGAADFAAYGTERSKGFGIFSLSGHVTRPGQYEAPLGTTLRELLDLAGGIRSGHRLKFWTPGGSSTPLFTDEHLDVPLDYESVAAAGSMLGTRSVQLFDETTCVVRVVLRWIKFYEHESCGKCTPCREGSCWVVQLLEQLERGEGSEADLDKLLDICSNITGRAFCALGDSIEAPVKSSIRYFQDEYLEHQRHRRLPVRPGRARRLFVDGVRLTVRRCRLAQAAGTARDGHRDHRRVRDHRAQGHAGDPGRRAARHPDPPVLRSSAARPGRRLPAVPGAHRGPAQAARLLHHRPAPRAWSCTPSSPRPWRRRPSAA